MVNYIYLNKWGLEGNKIKILLKNLKKPNYKSNDDFG